MPDKSARLCLNKGEIHLQCHGHLGLQLLNKTGVEVADITRVSLTTRRTTEKNSLIGKIIVEGNSKISLSSSLHLIKHNTIIIYIV